MQGLFVAFMIDTDAPQCSAAHSEGVMGGLVKEEMERDFGAGCSRDEGLQLLVEE